MTVDQVLGLISGRVCNLADNSAGHAVTGLKAAFIEKIQVTQPAELVGSGASDLCYFFSKEYQGDLPKAAPGILITGEAFMGPLQSAAKAGFLPLWNSCAVIAVADPYFAMAVISAEFERMQRPKPTTGIHPTAVLAPSAKLGKGVVIGPYSVVEEGAVLGDGVVLDAHVFVGRGSRLGADCKIFSNVVIYHDVEVGERVRIHANTTIGSDGFGYAPIRDGSAVTGHQKIYHLGRVVIGDDVEIGANCAVDRATLGVTQIGAMAKLDNHVHVAHNAKIESGAILCGGVALAGGAEIGPFAYLGGMSGVVNRIRVGAGALVGAMTLVTKDVEPGGNAVGIPQRTQREHFKVHALLNRMLASRKKSEDIKQ